MPTMLPIVIVEYFPLHKRYSIVVGVVAHGAVKGGLYEVRPPYNTRHTAYDNIAYIIISMLLYL